MNKNQSGISGVGSGLIGHDPEKEFYGPIAENVNTNNYFANSHYDL